MNPNQPNRWMIWVDGVGGFSILARSPWLVGGPAAKRDGAICVQAALGRKEAELIRSSGDYYLRLKGAGGAGEGARGAGEQRWDATEQNETAKRVERPLRRHDTFRLGEGVQFVFCCPHPLSASARLTLESRFRFLPHADAILLLADTLVLGATQDCHVVAPHAEQTNVLFRRGNDWFCKPFETGAGANVRMESGRRLEVGGISLTLEPA